MGFMGLALTWEATIPRPAQTWERRVEPFRQEPATTVSDADAARLEDSALAAACQRGEMDGYERLYALQGARMKNLARNILGSSLDGEDAVQETFLKIQRSIGSFRGQSSFVTWVFRILVNTCYDARRRRLRKKEFPQQHEPDDSAPAPEPRAPSAHPSLRLALERALGELTRHQRDVFLLYEVEGFRHSEIAQMLEITEAASKNSLFQAKKNLRQKLEPPRAGSAGGLR
jgi:RNA polymerase sigma-70 factor, ECF subfamily